MPVFVQCKLRLSVSCDAGLRTTNPKHFYCLRKHPFNLPTKYGGRHEELEGLVKNFKQQMGILIAYPGNWTGKTVSFYNEESGRGRFEQLFDRKNAHLILDEAHISLLNNMKGI